MFLSSDEDKIIGAIFPILPKHVPALFGGNRDVFVKFTKFTLKEDMTIIFYVSGNIDTIFGDTGKLTSLMDEHFGENGKVKSVITEYFGKHGLIIKELFDPMKEGTPIHQLKLVLLEELNRIKMGIGIKEAEEDIHMRQATGCKMGPVSSISFVKCYCDEVN